MRKTLIFSLTLALAAPTALWAQAPPTGGPPAEGASAPAPPTDPKPPEKKTDGAVETIGGAVGGVLGSAAGAAGGPVGSAAAGLVGKSVGRNTASFMKRIFGGKKDKDEPQVLQVAAPVAPAAPENAVETAAAAPGQAIPEPVSTRPAAQAPIALPAASAQPMAADVEVPAADAAQTARGDAPIVDPLAEPAAEPVLAPAPMR